MASRPVTGWAFFLLFHVLSKALGLDVACFTNKKLG